MQQVYRLVREYHDRYPDKAIVAWNGGAGFVPIGPDFSGLSMEMAVAGMLGVTPADPLRRARQTRTRSRTAAIYRTRV